MKTQIKKIIASVPPTVACSLDFLVSFNILSFFRHCFGSECFNSVVLFSSIFYINGSLFWSINSGFIASTESSTALLYSQVLRFSKRNMSYICVVILSCSVTLKQSSQAYGVSFRWPCFCRSSCHLFCSLQQ